MCTYLEATNLSQRMGDEVCQERHVIYRGEDCVSKAYTALWRIFNSWHDEILRYGAGGKRSLRGSRPLQRRPQGRSTRRSPRRVVRRVGRSGTTANSNANPKSTHWSPRRAARHAGRSSTTTNSNSKFSPTVWMNFQTRSDYPVVI